MSTLLNMRKHSALLPVAGQKALALIGGITALGLATCVQAAPAFDSDSKWMLGDWGGTRSELEKQGVLLKGLILEEADAEFLRRYYRLSPEKTGKAQNH